MKLKSKNGGLNTYFSKFFKLLEIIFFIKPYADIKLKKINFFSKKKTINKLFVQKKKSLIFNNF